MAPLSLVVQTTYAELLERCAAAAFAEAFAEDGSFTSKIVHGRTYWYFQTNSAQGREQRYVGPETPQLLARIGEHRRARNDERERRALVSTLVRSFGLTPPFAEIGEVVAALARAGAFRLRGVLVGTVAYQCYPAMLGVRFPRPLQQTGDVDVAQFGDVSIAVGERTAPMYEVLKKLDPTYRKVPRLSRDPYATSYQAEDGLRVDFLTPNVGPETDDPQSLPALQTEAQPLRFLDFLIHDPEAAVVLYGPGIYVQVPAPERYAVHKLIVSQRRRAGAAKAEKDLAQAQALIEVLVDKRPQPLKGAWEEAFARGRKWRLHLLDGLKAVAPNARDLLLRTANLRRAIVPGMDLTFNNPPARYDSQRDVVAFEATALGSPVECAVSREALEDHFRVGGPGKDARLEAFLANRTRIEQLVRAKYLTWPVEESDIVLLRTLEVEALSAALTQSARG
jgi:hypothetical protein